MPKRSSKSKAATLRVLDSVQHRAGGWWIYFTDQTRSGPFKSIADAVSGCKQITEKQIVEAFFGKV